MRHLTITICFFSALILCVYSCKKKQEQVQTNPFVALTEEYAKTELAIANLDSVSVEKIDTVDAWEYASIMVELLQQMDNEALYAYQAALQVDDTIALHELDIQMEEIAAAGQQWQQEVDALEHTPKTTSYYLITANYYAGDSIDQFYFFATPELQIHIADPFDEL